MYYWEDPLFDWSCSGHTESDYGFLFGKTQCLNKSRMDEALLEPTKYQIDPTFEAIEFNMMTNEKFREWCFRELEKEGLFEPVWIDGVKHTPDISNSNRKVVVDEVLRTIPTAKLIKELDMCGDHLI